MKTPRKTWCAFTLLEVLLAISVAGLLIAAASYMIVSLSTIWTFRTDEDSFEEHADGVATFLRKAFDEASSRYQPTWTEQQDSDTETETASEKVASADSAKSDGLWTNAGVTMARIDDTSTIEIPTLHFYFFQFPPALGMTSPSTNLGVEAWLKFDEKKGLAIVWKDIWSIQETTVTDEKDLLRTSVLSPFVTKIDYIYWDSDSKRWEEYDAPHESSDTYSVPTFIRLTFTMEGRDTVRMSHVRATEQTMPLF